MPGRNMISNFLLAAVFFLILLQGCGGSSQKTAPQMGFGSFDIRAEISRNDIEVLDRVEGTSTSKTYLGVVEIVDGDKMKLFGIPFFREQYTPYGVGSLWVSAEDRAYYKALGAAPGADVVFFKSMDKESEGVPLIWGTKSVTLKGKAIRLKADQ